MATSPGPPPSKAWFEPHRAVYNVKLTSRSSGAQIINVVGTMSYEWAPVCDTPAWISKHGFDVRYDYAEQPSAKAQNTFENIETFDGTAFTFSSERKRDGKVIDMIDGAARIENGKVGKAVFNMPRGVSYDLPAGTQFPIAHSLSMLDAIRENKTFFTKTIFDGSDEDGPVSVNVFIGKLLKMPAVQTKEIDENLYKSPARKLRLAFFPLSSNKETPDYEMTLTFHENSVISDILIEYPDFSIAQSLISLEKPEKTCHTVISTP